MSRSNAWVLLAAVAVLVVGFGVVAQNSEGPIQSANQLDEIATGEQVYGAMCASCHGIDGTGGFGPALDGNAAVQSSQFVIRQIVLGGGGMPAFGPPQLSPERIAAVVSHVRTAWGNDFGEITAQEVTDNLPEENGADDGS